MPTPSSSHPLCLVHSSHSYCTPSIHMLLHSCIKPCILETLYRIRAKQSLLGLSLRFPSNLIESTESPGQVSESPSPWGLGGIGGEGRVSKNVAFQACVTIPLTVQEYWTVTLNSCCAHRKSRKLIEGLAVPLSSPHSTLS